MCSDHVSCGEILAPPAKLVKRMARGVVLAAEPGPSCWRNAGTAAIGGLAVLREWMGTWTHVVVPHQTAKPVTAATIAPLDCGPMKTEPWQHLPQPCPRKLRPIALADVLKLTESCVVEQHIDRLLKTVEPTNLGLGTPDAAALIVRILPSWANDMAGAPKQEQDADVVLPSDLENAFGRHASKRRGAHARSLQPGETPCCPWSSGGGGMSMSVVDASSFTRL